MVMKQIKTPALNKLARVAPKSQAIGEFLEWLHGTKRCVCEQVFGEFVPARATTEQLLAEYFKVNLAAVEQERRALLDALRKKEHA